MDQYIYNYPALLSMQRMIEQFVESLADHIKQGSIASLQ
jgi:hypothetical protein